MTLGVSVPIAGFQVKTRKVAGTIVPYGPVEAEVLEPRSGGSRRTKLPADLYERFLVLEGSNKAITKFAGLYGNLNSSPDTGETLNMWRFELRYLQLLSAIWGDCDSNNATAVRHSLGKLAQLTGQQGTLPPQSETLEYGRYVVMDAIDRHFTQFCYIKGADIEPTAMLDVVWLQFSQSIKSGARRKLCAGPCGRFIVARRSTKRYCKQCASRLRKQRHRDRRASQASIRKGRISLASERN